MALGALSGNVVRLIMREAALLIGIGVAIALPAAFALTRLVRSQLYGVEPHDPLTLIGATVGLSSVALLAGFIPAWRACRADPVKILRYE
jgi:ABC-type antimicrobial peptide transport system permease subunit